MKFFQNLSWARAYLQFKISKNGKITGNTYIYIYIIFYNNKDILKQIFLSNIKLSMRKDKPLMIILK